MYFLLCATNMPKLLHIMNIVLSNQIGILQSPSLFPSCPVTSPEQAKQLQTSLPWFVLLSATLLPSIYLPLKFLLKTLTPLSSVLWPCSQSSLLAKWITPFSVSSCLCAYFHCSTYHIVIFFSLFTSLSTQHLEYHNYLFTWLSTTLSRLAY